MNAANFPIGFTELEPTISRETVANHFLHHHRVHYERVAELIRGTELEGYGLEDVIRAGATRPRQARLMRHAALAWNHDFYWNSLLPGGSGGPEGSIKNLIDQTFGNFDRFVTQAVSVATHLIGYGWLWITWQKDLIGLTTTTNADSPLLHGYTPLLGLDLWEHAYYLDYCGSRRAYVVACLHELMNWEFANRRLNLLKPTWTAQSALLDQ